VVGWALAVLSDNPTLVEVARNHRICKTLDVKILRYVELKSGYHDGGPAWIGYVTQSKSGRTLYFNGRGLMKLKGQRRGASGGNYVDMETGESFWVSGVKKNGQDRHSAGSGKVLIEATGGQKGTMRCFL
jgi:hypothetical protein